MKKVKALQTFLKAFGSDIGPVDGVFSTRTLAGLEGAAAVLSKLAHESRHKDRLPGADRKRGDSRLIKVYKRLLKDSTGWDLDFTFRRGEWTRTATQQKRLLDAGIIGENYDRHLEGMAFELQIMNKDGSICYDRRRYEKLADKVKQAAEAVNVIIEWGGAWGQYLNFAESADAAEKEYQAQEGDKHTQRFGYFQLPREHYPEYNDELGEKYA